MLRGRRWGLSAVKADTAPLLSSVEEIDGEADLEELTASSEAAVETGATLAARQADALEAASQELLCSPDITKYASDQLFRCHAMPWHYTSLCGFGHCHVQFCGDLLLICLECRASGLFSWRQGSHVSIMEGMLTCCPL